MTALPGYGLHVSVSKLFRRDTFGSNHMEAIIEVNPDVMKCVQFAEDFSCRHLYFTYIIHLIEGHYGPASRIRFLFDGEHSIKDTNLSTQAKSIKWSNTKKVAKLRCIMSSMTTY